MLHNISRFILSGGNSRDFMHKHKYEIAFFKKNFTTHNSKSFWNYYAIISY